MSESQNAKPTNPLLIVTVTAAIVLIAVGLGYVIGARSNKGESPAATSITVAKPSIFPNALAFAEELGRVNSGIFAWRNRFPEEPAEGSPEAVAYTGERDRLLAALELLDANDSVVEAYDDGQPESLSLLQAHLAKGVLGLDPAQTGAVQAILERIYTTAIRDVPTGPFPTAADEAAFEKRVDDLSRNEQPNIAALLRPEQREQFSRMGFDAVFYGFDTLENYSRDRTIPDNSNGVEAPIVTGDQAQLPPAPGNPANLPKTELKPPTVPNPQ